MKSKYDLTELKLTNLSANFGFKSSYLFTHPHPHPFYFESKPYSSVILTEHGTIKQVMRYMDIKRSYQNSLNYPITTPSLFMFMFINETIWK